MEAMMNYYKRGDHVEFTGTRGRRSGQLFQGVVTDGPTGKQMYYSVSCTEGQFKVAASILKPSAVGNVVAKSLLANGDSFHARNEKNKELRTENNAKRCLDHIDFFKLSPGMVVKNKGVEGWPTVTIYEVDRETGKCKVDSSTAGAAQLVRQYGLSIRRNFKSTSWVLANRLFPV